MTFAVRIENLGKRYQLGLTHAGSIREAVNRAFGRLLRRQLSPVPDGRAAVPGRAQGDGVERGSFWALRDVSFEVKPGEVVGIIGRNGSGKSTLLKIISEITAPTRGRVELRGRVASLLEVGTGFHPELTGRENVFLNGALLGMTQAEVRRRFDEIVTFAEIADFIDTPVKRYSSGMYVRLAFAVAAHLEPEIVLVDEVLAVGDAAFQKKCLGKMGDAAKHGRTVLFVSHDLGAVGRLCSSAVWLDRGQVVYSGGVRTAVARYVAATGPTGTRFEWPDPDAAPGDEFLRALRVEILDGTGRELEAVHQDEPLTVRIVYRVLKPMASANVGFELRVENGTVVFTSYDADHPEWCGRGRRPGDYAVECVIPANYLNEGTYYLTLMAGIPSIKLCIRAEDVARLLVSRARTGNNPVGRMGSPRPGVVAPELQWVIRPLD